MMSLARITQAYNSVRSGRVRTVPLSVIRAIFIAAHSTEFFTRDQEMVIEKIETAMPIAA